MSAAFARRCHCTSILLHCLFSDWRPRLAGHGHQTRKPVSAASKAATSAAALRLHRMTPPRQSVLLTCGLRMPLGYGRHSAAIDGGEGAASAAVIDIVSLLPAIAVTMSSSCSKCCILQLASEWERLQLVHRMCRMSHSAEDANPWACIRIGSSACLSVSSHAVAGSIR